eukprot:Lankesteria_metandrocarpae@DN5182_c0_g1_i1.p1
MRRDDNQQQQQHHASSRGRMSLLSGRGLVIRPSGGDGEYVEESRKIGELIRFIENVADAVIAEARCDGARAIGAEPLAAFGGDTHSQLQAARDTASSLNRKLHEFTVFLQTESSEETARRRMMHQNMKENFKAALRRLEVAAEGALVRAHQYQNVDLMDDHHHFQSRTAIMSGDSRSGPTADLPYHPFEQSTSPQDLERRAYGRFGDPMESALSATSDSSIPFQPHSNNMNYRSNSYLRLQQLQQQNYINTTTGTNTAGAGASNTPILRQEPFDTGSRNFTVAGRAKSPAGVATPLQSVFYSSSTDPAMMSSYGVGSSNLTPLRGVTGTHVQDGSSNRRNSGLSTAASSYVAIERFARPLASSADMLDTRILQERRDNLSRMHRDIEGLQELYFDMDSSVDDQGLRISEIESQMSGAANATMSATDHLTRAAQVRRSRWRLALVATVLLVSLLLLADVTRHFILP